MRALVIILVALLVFQTAPSAASRTQAPPLPEPSNQSASLDEESGVKESPEDLAEDLALIAEANGWSVESAAASHAAAEAIGHIAVQVARERPEAFVGSVLAVEPGGAPTLYIKGAADQLITDLVAASPVRIIVIENQPFSFDELEARKLRVHHALEALGFRYVATSVNTTGGGVIPAGVSREPGLPTSVEDILLALPADLRSAVDLTIHDGLNVGDRNKAFGGMMVRDNATGNFCTSGWTVRQIATGTLGITTAGHCQSIDDVVHPGFGFHALTFKGEHRGQWGDIEWHTTIHPEPDDFYSDAVNIRDVSAIEPRAGIATNETVCLYGRGSNDRDCSLEVQDVSQACTNDGVFNDRLVMMNGTTGAGGDSGGGWSVGGKAYGSDKGWCFPNFPNNDAWSVADLYDEALGVQVTCGC